MAAVDMKKRRKTNKIILGVVGGLLALIVAAGIGSALSGGGDVVASQSPTPDAVTEPTATAEPAEVSGVTVPDVAGLAGDEARAAIEGAGLTAEFDAGDEVVVLEGNWNVNAQEPAAGAETPEGSVVTLTVAKPEPTTPPVDPATTTPSGLTTARAISTCDQLGESQAPYGWNADFLFDGTQTVDGDTILLVAGVDVTNQYGAEGRFAVECRVSGTEDAPVVDSFDVY